MNNTTRSKDSGAALTTERLVSAAPQEIFAAFENPERLARWWGPEGFTNTFHLFEFRPGGQWIFTMHGPNGHDYANEIVFREVEPGRRIMLEHVVEPWFELAVTLIPRAGQTQLFWKQEFETAVVAAKLRPICEPANEQNLDRLQALLLSESSDS